MSERNLWVDYAKAIGIVLVVYGHVDRGLFNSGLHVNKDLFLLIDSIIYSFHMPLFFFLSGLFFLSSFKRRGAGDLVLSKIDTIVYPYLLWSILQGSVQAVMSEYTNGNASFSGVFALWEPKAQFWFLYALFFIFIVATILTMISPKRGVLIVGAVGLFLYFYNFGFAINFFVVYIANNLIYFALGMMLMAWFKIEKLGQKQWLLGLAAAFVIGQYLFHGPLGLDYQDKGLALFLLASVSILFVVSISVWLTQYSQPWLLALGVYSMGIYVMHTLASSSLRIIFDKFLGVENYTFHLVLGCAAAILLPLIALKIIEKFKIPYVLSAPISKPLRALIK